MDDGKCAEANLHYSTLSGAASGLLQPPNANCKAARNSQWRDARTARIAGLPDNGTEFQRSPPFALLQLSRMELAIRVRVEELPEGLFLATSDELEGLVAQGRTVAETLEIARDVARKLLEARRERGGTPRLPSTSERQDYTIVVAA